MDIRAGLKAFDHYLTGIPEQFPWFVALLLGTGIFITLRLGFIQLRQLKHAFQVIAGHFDDPEDEGDVTHFQALTMALSATVGVGNIAGVAIALHYGGPGAIFWMWMTAIFGMALKYAECTLAIRYRRMDSHGEAAGGPMYYIQDGMGLKPVGVFFAVCAVICSFGTGNMNQSNTIASVILGRGLTTANLTGLALVCLVGAVILGGVKRIAGVTERLAPTMAGIYFAGAATIVLLNIGQVPGVLGEILSGAITPQGAFGGTMAGTFVFTLLHGVRRGLFSNEAGQGSAAIAHASAKTHESVREGVVAMTGPMIDTLIICTMTALAILVTGAWNTKFEQTWPANRVVICKGIDAKGNYDRHAGPIEVRAGVVQGFTVASNHATVDEALFALGGKAFSGTLQVDDGYVAGAPEGLGVQGKALLTGAQMTSKAFQLGLARIFPHGDLIVDISVLLFALSTIIGWSYYGDRSCAYLFGADSVTYYRLVYLVFVYVGSVAALDLVWAFGDVALSLMSIPNLIAILWLHKEVLADTDEYFSRDHVPLR